MTTATPTAKLASCLARALPAAVALTPTRWQLDLPAGPTRFLFELTDEWLCCRAGLNGHDHAPTQANLSLLSRQTQIGSGVKFAADAHGHLEVRAELPCPQAVLADAVIQELINDLRAALASVPDERPPDPSAAAEKDGAEAAAGKILEGTCAEAGWPGRARPEGGILIELEPAELGLSANVTPAAAGRFRAAVDLLELGLFENEPSRDALARCLLRLNGAVRGVRAAVRTRGGVEFVVLEAYGHDARSSCDVTAVLSGLSLAGRLCAAEVDALADPELSRHYLALVDRDAADNETNNKERSATSV